MTDLASARRAFAEKIRALSGLRSNALLRALATVPREAFVGPGPWQILRLSELRSSYSLTPDASPWRIYDNVLVALDPARGLNNGEPAALLRWLDQLDLTPGERLLHLGCGVGYYTAIAAAAVDPGEVVGIELDPKLAERARRNLARWPRVRVECGDGRELPVAAFDAIFVNAGVTEVLPSWLDALRDGGRLLLPLTVDLPQSHLGGGWMLLAERVPGGYSARFTSTVGIFPCAGARSPEGQALLSRAYQHGGHERVRRLRRDAHAPGPECWLHAQQFCLAVAG